MSVPERISILLSTHNGAAFLDAQLRSIRNQTIPDWLLIVHDDGSTDETCAIVARHSEADQRVTVLDERMAGGVAETYLALLSRVDTPYFAFADQDDVWRRDKLAAQLSRLREVGLDDPDQVGLVSCDAQPTGPTLVPRGRTVRDRQAYRSFDEVTLGRLLFQNPIPGNTILGTRALAMLASGVLAHTDHMASVAMHDWWTAILASAHGRLTGIENTGVLYRQHGANARGAPSGTRDRIGNFGNRPLSTRTSTLVAPAVAHSRLARAVLPSSVIDTHRGLLDSVEACGAEPEPSRRALLECWRQGGYVRPLPGQLALIAGGR